MEIIWFDFNWSLKKPNITEWKYLVCTDSLYFKFVRYILII